MRSHPEEGNCPKDMILNEKDAAIGAAHLRIPQIDIRTQVVDG